MLIETSDPSRGNELLAGIRRADGLLPYVSGGFAVKLRGCLMLV